MNIGIISIGAITLGVLAGIFALVKKNVIVGIVAALLVLGGIIALVVGSRMSSSGSQKALPQSGKSNTTQAPTPIDKSGGTGVATTQQAQPVILPTCKLATEAYKNVLNPGRTGLPWDQWVVDNSASKIRAQPEYNKLYRTPNEAFDGAKAAHARVKVEMLRAHPQALSAINDVFSNKLNTNQEKVTNSAGVPNGPLAIGQEPDVNCKLS